jgi:hypothetical protein
MSDYIMRLIRQVAQMVAAIMGHRNAGRDAEAAVEIERACVQTAGVPLSLVRQASPEALRQFLQSGGPQRVTRDVMLAELLLQDAELQEKNGQQKEAAHSRAHAFCLIVDAVDSLTLDDAAHYRAKLDALAAELTSASVSSDPYVSQKVQAWMRRVDLTGSARPA